MAICFDVDGTLYNLRSQQLRMVAHFLRHPRILRVWRDQVEAIRGEKHADLGLEIEQRVAQVLGIETERVTRVIQTCVWEGYPESFRPGDLLEGFPALFEAIDARGWPRAIVSDHPSLRKLERMEIETGWQAIVDCSGMGALKPLPDGLLVAAEAMDTAPEDVVLIGDRQSTDGGMAEAAGARFLLRGRDWHKPADLWEPLGLAPADLPQYSEGKGAHEHTER